MAILENIIMKSKIDRDVSNPVPANGRFTAAVTHSNIKGLVSEGFVYFMVTTDPVGAENRVEVYAPKVLLDGKRIRFPNPEVIIMISDNQDYWIPKDGFLEAKWDSVNLRINGEYGFEGSDTKFPNMLGGFEVQF